MWWLTFFVGWVLASIWLIRSIKVAQFINQKKLSCLAHQLTPITPSPKVSIIIPARDEEQKIRNCLVSITKSDYLDLEIICVNDRSLDRTGKIMEEMALEDKRIKVIHVNELPKGWLGKTHAMLIAAQIATGDYLLFTDADVIYNNKVVSYAINYILTKNVDHLCLLPEFISGQYWKNIFTVYLIYTSFLHMRPELIPDPSSTAHAGVGPFNLVKKDTYNIVGGVEQLRLEILEDMKLGWLIKTAGYRSELLLADDLLSFEWHKGLWGIIRGIEKNMYAALNYSFVQSIIATVFACSILFMLYGSVFIFDDMRMSGYIFALMVAHIGYGYYASKTGKGWGIAWAFPFAVLINLYALWRSLIITHYHGGVRWRDSFYSLKSLKEYNANAKKSGT